MELIDNEAGEYAAFLEEWLNVDDHVTAHTSGSTGMPKEIRLAKKDMELSARATNEFFGINERSTLVIPLSASYIAGKMMLVRAKMAGCRLIAEKASNRPLGVVGDSIKNSDIELIAIVPSQIEGLMSSPCFDKVKNVIVGGAPMSAEQEKKTVESGKKFYATYGMTETCSHVALRRCGKEWYEALPRVKFGRDDRGCLIVEREGVSENHRLVTNDIVELAANNRFKWIGRADNVIISGGLKVYPEEVERKIAHLIQRPYYVGRINDEKWGERPALYIEGVEMPDVERLKVELGKVLKREEMPSMIQVVKEIPRTSNGKIKR